MSECTAYIADMSRPIPSARFIVSVRPRYEARLRDGIGQGGKPLRASEINVLISLNYRPEGAEDDCRRIGEAKETAIRTLLERLTSQARPAAPWPVSLYERSAAGVTALRIAAEVAVGVV